MDNSNYLDFIRNRITELRIKKDVSEHRMSLDLDKNGSYIRGISSGANMPSVKELLNIIAYFHMTPADFFAPIGNTDTPYHRLCSRLSSLSDTELEKVNTFLDLITEQK